MRKTSPFRLWIRFLSVLLVPLMSCQTSRSQLEEPTPVIDEASRSSFERLKSLSSEWVGTVGRSTASPAQVTFFVTGKGTAIVERMIIEDPVEMVSVYFLERGRLVMAHFCAAGNQPRMVLAQSARPGMLFALAGDRKFDVSRDTHMHSREVIQRGEELLMVWETYINGRSESRDTMFLKRRG